MPPDNKKAKAKNIIPSFINQGGTTTVLTVNGEEEQDGNAGVTYFVDEEGRYYYQPSGENQNLVSLAGTVSEDNVSLQEALPEEDPMMVEGDRYQTVTLVPSESSTGEVSYVLVVQDQVGKVEQEEKSTDDVYQFEEEEERQVEQEEEEEDKKPKPAATKKNNRQYLRPHFTCSFCSYTSHRRYLLLRHMKTHSEDRPHKCSVCERGFKTLASLQNHVNMHNGVKPHICKYCKSPFTTSGELVRHVRYKHTHEKPHKCTECDYASVELSKLRRHVRCHTGERPYQCPHCTYASPDMFKLKRHLRTHTGEKPYKCDHCNMCFTQSNSLKAHKLIHNVAEKPVFACELCPAKCGRKTDLRIHVQKLHTSDKPLKCKRCGKSFPDRYSCKVHNKTHEGEKCYKCELCPYASTTLRHLKSHMLKHTDEKPFVCDQCDQSFRQKQLLRRHQNLYHNPDYVPKPPKEKTHTCHECKRTFAHKGNLIRHLAVHDPESSHQDHTMALKIGRQTNFLEGTEIQVEPASSEAEPEESENEEDQSDMVKLGLKELKRGELVTVANGDGEQYVFLEVIQLEDGTEQQVAVVAPDYIDEEPEEEAEEEEEEEEHEVKDVKIVAPRPPDRNIKLEKEVDTCFGFDEDEEQDEEYNEKIVLRLG
ncbi:transcriptional repressor CTCF-like isoform X2 [Plodia interpunctella]|uniref:transcriptional repressor CTCF-like isoform X2 n=1 Tax=Plodia interpunctella TaxID=58824 RepID=UPI002368C2CD|nr:transcriptional repressor CTCF-like isoform X2 [Plodia interpunctella]